MPYLPDESAHNAVRIFARHFDQLDEPGMTLDQDCDMAVFSASEEVALPMPRNRSVLYLGRPLSDRYRVDDPATRLPAGGRMFASAYQSPRS